MKKQMTKLLAVLSLTVALCLALAVNVSAESGTAAASMLGGSGISMIVMVVVMIAVFYFLMIRPENKKRKKAEEMRNSLSVGDKITTIGGMVGKIVHIGNDLITFETGEDRVRIQVTKWAISTNDIQKTEDPKS